MATLFNGLNRVISFQVAANYDCNLAVITPIQVQPQIYSVTQKIHLIDIAPYTSDHPDTYCGTFHYYALNQDLSLIDSSVF